MSKIINHILRTNPSFSTNYDPSNYPYEKTPELESKFAKTGWSLQNYNQLRRLASKAKKLLVKKYKSLTRDQLFSLVKVINVYNSFLEKNTPMLKLEELYKFINASIAKYNHLPASQLQKELVIPEGLYLYFTAYLSHENGVTLRPCDVQKSTKQQQPYLLQKMIISIITSRRTYPSDCKEQWRLFRDKFVSSYIELGNSFEFRKIGRISTLARTVYLEMKGKSTQQRLNKTI